MAGAGAGDGKLVIDAAPVYTRLWVGAFPPVDRTLPEFTTLLLCAQELQPTTLAFGGRVIRCGIDDAAITQDEVSRIVSAAREALVDWRQGGRVLVTCAMGINRSALTAAVMLREITRAPVDKVIATIRKRRDRRCLSNPTFVKVLKSMPERPELRGRWARS